MSKRAGLGILALAGVLLGLIWVFSPPFTPPMYEGIQHFPPYRYLNPPPELINTPAHHNPTSGSATEKIVRGRFALLVVNTRENPPQAILQFGDSAIIIPSGVTAVKLTIRPVQPPAPVSDGDLNGNVYLFTGTYNDGKPAQIDPKIRGLLQIRKTQQAIVGDIEHFENGSWVKVRTLGFVNPSYLATDASKFGYYAVVASSTQPTFIQRFLPLLIAGLVIVVLVVAALVAIRITRRRPLEVA